MKKDTILEEFALSLRKLRNKSNLYSSREKVSFVTDFSVSSLQAWEEGRAEAKLINIIELIKVYGSDVAVELCRIAGEELKPPRKNIYAQDVGGTMTEVLDAVSECYKQLFKESDVGHIGAHKSKQKAAEVFENAAEVFQGYAELLKEQAEYSSK
jgi:hypothetical protein